MREDGPAMVGRPRMDDGLDEFAVEVRPPKDLQVALSHPDRSTLCGGRFAVQVTARHPLVVYCYRPNCIQTGRCSGPRFVPALPLVELSAVLLDDEGKPAQSPREMPKDRAGSKRLMAEMVQASRAAAKTALKKDDERSDEEIAIDIALVWSKTAQSARRGGWGP